MGTLGIFLKWQISPNLNIALGGRQVQFFLSVCFRVEFINHWERRSAQAPENSLTSPSPRAPAFSPQHLGSEAQKAKSAVTLPRSKNLELMNSNKAIELSFYLLFFLNLWLVLGLF